MELFKTISPSAATVKGPLAWKPAEVIIREPIIVKLPADIAMPPELPPQHIKPLSISESAIDRGPDASTRMLPLELSWESLCTVLLLVIAMDEPLRVSTRGVPTSSVVWMIDPSQIRNMQGADEIIDK